MKRLTMFISVILKGKEVKQEMKRLLIVIAVAAITIGVGLSGSAWATHNGDLETNTITTNSDRLGLDPTGHMAAFTQDGSGTIGTADALTDYFPVGNPGAFTNNPFNIVCENADYGRGFIPLTTDSVTGDVLTSTCQPNANGNAFFFLGGDPMTAPDFQGPNSAVGNIVVKVPVSLSSSVASGDLILSGTIDFCLQLTTNTKICDNNPDPNADPNSAAQQGLAVVTQTFDQTLSPIDTTDPNNPVAVGTQRVIVDNTDPNTGGPITFMTAEGSQTSALSPARDIPWSLSVTQDIPLSVTDVDGPGPLPPEIFQLAVSGTYQYQGPIENNTVGLTGNAYPAQGTFDLPGFSIDTNGDGVFENRKNFPDHLDVN